MNKKHLLHTTLALAFFHGAALSAFAQEAVPPAAATVRRSASAGGSDSRNQKGRGGAGFQSRIERAVGLNAEQRESVRGLLAQQRQDLQAVRDEMEPKYTAVQERTDGKIRALLNPEQQKKFDAFLAKQKQMKQARSRKSS